MKQLEIKQMETVEGGGWGCAFSILAGAFEYGLVGGPVGLAIGATIGAVGCYADSAS